MARGRNTTGSTARGRGGSGSSARGRASNVDLTTSEGLLNVAEDAGGAVDDAAQEIAGNKPSLLKKVGATLKTGLTKTLDVLQRPNFAIASATKNVIDEDKDTTLLGGLGSGITGRTKNTFSDVFTEAGLNPESKVGKIGKGVAGFALDVLLDPTTYITFGAGAGVKVGTKLGTKALTKEGAALLSKGLAQKAGQEFGEDFVKQSIVRLAESSPELYQKFIDQGGLKFFGSTIMSGGRISGVLKGLPGANHLSEATEPIRNNLYALFNRDASATYGKLPKEFIDIKQRYIDLGKVKSDEAINSIVDIAKANKLTSPEAEIISNAIESKLHLADDRLENVRKLIEQKLGRNLKDEQKAGIAIGELPNYVPHILVDTPSKNIPFKAEGVSVNLGASKERSIEGTISEINTAFGKDFFDSNIINTAAIRGVASARAVTATDFLREVASKFGTPSKTAPSNFVEATAKELAGFKFHPAIAEQLNTFKKGFIGDQATNNLLRAFDKAQNFWKASVTAIFPAFHGRNAISNVFLNFLDVGRASISPGKHYLSSSLLNQNRQAGNLERLALGVEDSVLFRSGEKGNYFSSSKEYIQQGGWTGPIKEVSIPSDAKIFDATNISKLDELATPEELAILNKKGLGPTSAETRKIHQAILDRNGYDGMKFLDEGTSGKSYETTFLTDNGKNILKTKSTSSGATKAKAELKELLDKKILTDDFGKSWTFGELRTEIKNRRVAFGDEFTGFLDIREGVESKLGRESKGINVNPFSQQNVAFKAGRLLGNKIEQQARVLNFITNLEKTGNVTTAAERTKQFLFDYTNLSDFEKNVMRRLVPFYTFTRKNLELQAGQFLEQPGKFATQAKAFKTFEEVVSGATLTDDEKGQLPDFLQEGLGIVFEREGNQLSIISSLGTPIEQVFSAIKPNSILGSLTPIAAVPLQVAIGKHFFFDRDLKDVNDAKSYQNAPQFIKDYIGYTTRTNKNGTLSHIALNPTRLFILNNIPPSSRVVSVIGQLEEENVSGKLKTLRQLTGLKPYGVDLDTQSAIKERQKVRSLQDLLNTTGIAPIFRRSFIPKE